MNETEVIIPKKVFLSRYRHLLSEDADINFLWGSRDSGKSHFIAQRLIKKCMEASYFRGILIKETYEAIKDAQYQTIKDIVYEWGLDSLFIFKVSPLEIHCVNGNKFIARGCDDPGKLKSIKDPTDAWYEEGNQMTLSDFITITTTLRSNKVKTQQWFSYNPECEGNFEDFWLYKLFFKQWYEKGEFNFRTTIDIEIGKNEFGESITVPITYTSTHTTFKDNPYCSGQRIAFLEQLKITDPYYYRVFALGLWGNKKNDAPFAYAFDRNRHLGKVERDNRYELIASFDFNKNPITAFICQILPGDKLRGIEQIKLENSDIYKLCDYINLKYPRALWKITGDATGANTTALVKDNLNYYQVIKEQLRLAPMQFKVPTRNPNIEENQLLVNAVLQICDCVFDQMKCQGLTFDFENVRMLPNGTIDKSSRTNAAMQADALDCFRYVCNAFLKHVLKGSIKKDQ